MTETTILDDSAVSEIEARAREVKGLVGVGQFGEDMLRLCATVKHLRQENQRAETIFKFIIPNHPFATIEELAKPVLDKVDQLQSQLEQLRAENERLSETIIKQADYRQKILKQSDFRSRAIQLCKDKAAEWEANDKAAMDVSGAHSKRVYAAHGLTKAEAARDLATELEQL